MKTGFSHKLTKIMLLHVVYILFARITTGVMEEPWDGARTCFTRAHVCMPTRTYLTDDGVELRGAEGNPERLEGLSEFTLCDAEGSRGVVLLEGLMNRRADGIQPHSVTPITVCNDSPTQKAWGTDEQTTFNRTLWPPSRCAMTPPQIRPEEQTSRRHSTALCDPHHGVQWQPNTEGLRNRRADDIQPHSVTPITVCNDTTTDKAWGTDEQTTFNRTLWPPSRCAMTAQHRRPEEQTSRRHSTALCDPHHGVQWQPNTEGLRNRRADDIQPHSVTPITVCNDSPTQKAWGTDEQTTFNRTLWPPSRCAMTAQHRRPEEQTSRRHSTALCDPHHGEQWHHHR